MSSSTIPDQGPAARRLAHWMRSLIDGPHPWGELNVGLRDRTGRAIHYRLVVYPPGITTAERRALVFRSRWPGAGVIVGGVLAVGLGSVVDGWLAITVAAGVFVAGLIAAVVATARTSHRVLYLRATVLAVSGHREVLGDLAALERAAGALQDLDARRERGLLSPVEHEHLWGEIYRELGTAIELGRSARRNTTKAR